MNGEKISQQIASRILWLLHRKDMKQRDLAKMMSKSDSEISTWLTGRHNFTIQTLSRLEEVLGARILTVAGTKFNTEERERDGAVL